MGNAAVIKCVPFGGPLEGFLILEDTFLEHLNLFCKAAILDGGVSLLVGDGGEKSVHNGVKEFSIDVWVCGEH